MARYFIEGFGQSPTPTPGDNGEAGQHFFLDMSTLERCHAQSKAKLKTKPSCGKFMALPGMRDCLFDGIDPDNEKLYNKCVVDGDEKACDDFVQVVLRNCQQHFPQSPLLSPNEDTSEEEDKWRREFDAGSLWHCYVGQSCIRVMPAEVTFRPNNSKYWVVGGILALTFFLTRKSK